MDFKPKLLKFFYLNSKKHFLRDSHYFIKSGINSMICNSKTEYQKKVLKV